MKKELSSLCKSCSFKNEPGSRYCNQCGEKLELLMQCGNCHSFNKAEAKFCNSCGQSFVSSSSIVNPEEKSEQTRSEIGKFSMPATDEKLDNSGLGWQINFAKKNTSEQPELDYKKNTEPKFKIISSKIPKVNKSSIVKALIAVFILTILYWWLYPYPELFVYLWAIVFLIVISLLIVLFPRIKKKIKNKSSQNERLFHQGEVRAFANRTENKKFNQPADTIWSFRLERYFEGQQLPPIPVEMRGQEFEGFINEGDTIKLLENWKAGLHKTNKVFNLTNNTLVKAKRGTSIFLINFIVIAIFIIVIGIIILALSNM